MNVTITPTPVINERLGAVVQLGTPTLKSMPVYTTGNIALLFDRPGTIRWVIGDSLTIYTNTAGLTLGTPTSTLIPANGVVNLDTGVLAPGTYTLYSASEDARGKNQSNLYIFEFEVV